MENVQFFLSSELAPRLAAIDVGTNSIRLIVAEALRDGKYRILDDERDATRLGRNLGQTGRLDPQAVELSLAALRRMKQIATGYQVRQLRAIATCAVREAADGPEFCRRAAEEAGVELQVITGRDEAQLAFIGVQRSFDIADKNVAVVDIGGGSTEIVLASNGLIEAIYTTQLGAVRLTEQHNAAQVVAADDFRTLMQSVERLLRRHVAKRLFVPQLLIGSGGTFTSLAAMVMARRGSSNLPLQGVEITQADVRHLLDRLRKMPAKTRRGVAGLSSDRADIIVAGLAIVDGVMRRLQVNRLLVHVGGVRDGLLLSMVDDMLAAGPQAPQNREVVLRRFAANCGVDVEHCLHVAMLAGSIYAQLARWFEMPPEDRDLLEAAAKLQDVGYLINYQRHHKHSYHLILNSRLPGFQPQELALVAIVARYHRGSKPRKSHAGYRQLSNVDRRRARRMAAILRLAIGFDRSHTQQTRGVDVTVDEGAVVFRPRGEAVAEADVWGARRRAKMFEKVYGVPLQIEWQPRGVAEPPPPETAPSAINGHAAPLEATSAARTRRGKGKRRPHAESAAETASP